MKRVKLGKKYRFIDGGKIRSMVVNAMFKGKVVFLDQDERSYHTFTVDQVKACSKLGTLKGV